MYEKAEFKVDVDWHVFRWACIMAGCDYLRGGVHGLGLIKALKLLKSLPPGVGLHELLEKLPGNEEFRKNFLLAENTFLHQVVMDPRNKEIRPQFPVFMLLDTAVEDVCMECEEES